MTVTSFTDSSKSYEVSPVSCTCPAFQYGRGKPCKHIVAVEVAKAERFLQVRREVQGIEESARCYREMACGF